MNRYITVQEAAQRWGIPPHQVHIFLQRKSRCKRNANEPYLDYSRKHRGADKNSITRVRKKNDK